MSRYCNDYYEKFPEAIKLKCEYDLDYIIKYGMVWYGNILFDIVHNIIENILTKHENI